MCVLIIDAETSLAKCNIMTKFGFLIFLMIKFCTSHPNMQHSAEACKDKNEGMLSLMTTTQHFKKAHCPIANCGNS